MMFLEKDWTNQMKMTVRLLKRAASGAIFLLLASGCGNTLLYSEGTGFNLGIKVNDHPSTPIDVNFGLERELAGVIPAKGNIETDAYSVKGPSGEAASLISGFDLRYVNDQGEVIKKPFGGTLKIRTQFVSGKAATTIAGGKKATQSLKAITTLRSPVIVSEELQARRKSAADWVKSLDENGQARLAGGLMLPASDLPSLLRQISQAETEASFNKFANVAKKLFGKDF